VGIVVLVVIRMIAQRRVPAPRPVE
jgi:hypothetical protein